MNMFSALLEINNVYLKDNYDKFFSNDPKKDPCRIKVKKKVSNEVISEWKQYNMFNYIERKEIREVFCKTLDEFKELMKYDTKGTRDQTTVFGNIFKTPMDKFNEAYSLFIEQCIQNGQYDLIKAYTDIAINEKDTIEVIKKKSTLQPIYNGHPPDSLIKTDYIWLSKEIEVRSIYSLPKISE